MKIAPIKKAVKHEYPDLYEAIRNPDLLKKNVPVSWRYKSLIIGALTAFVMAGCSPEKYRKPNITPTKPKTISVIEKKEGNRTNEEALLKKTKMVAPIFAHHRGEGNVGMTSPPFAKYLTEEQAKVIIRQELSEAGIDFDDNDEHKVSFIFRKVGDDFISEEAEFDTNGKPVDGYTYYSITLDGYNRKLNFGYEYISEDDIIYLDDPVKDKSESPQGAYSTAMQLRKVLDENNVKTKVAIFYCPIVNNYDGPVSQELYSKSPPILLREQVVDFILWARNNKIFDQINSNKGD